MEIFDMGLEDITEDKLGYSWRQEKDSEDTVLVDGFGEEVAEPSEMGDEESLENLNQLMALESLLKQDGLVSYGLAQKFEHHLPAHAPINSFTKMPTKVNYDIAVESIGGAIKLVALAGVLTLIGGLGVLVYKIVKRKKRMPDNAMDKKVSAAFASIGEKLKVGVEELRTMHPELKHPTLNWSREEAVIRVAERRGINECTAEILAGKYPFMGDKLYGLAADQGKQICNFLENQMVKQIEQLLKMGTEDDISALDDALNSFKVSDTADGELRAYCKTLGIEMGEEDHPHLKWQEKYGERLEQDAIKTRIGTIQPNFKPMGDVGIRQLLIVQERMAKIYQRLEKAIKSLEGKNGQVGGNYAVKLKELVNRTKEPLSNLSDVFAVSDGEVAAYQMSTRIKAEAITDGFSYLNDQYSDLEKTDKANASAYRECQKHLHQLFSNVKSTIK